MKFLVITHAIHKYKNDQFFSYEPYVREMNIWFKNLDEITILCPIKKNKVDEIDSSYNNKKITFKNLKDFNITTFKNLLKSILVIPKNILVIFKAMLKADHIHLRCPGNMALLGCFVQVFFPNKSKTVKYAGNWDPNSKQPITYRIQKWIVSNTFLTRNCKVLVYGEWKNQSKNIVPFFTASYNENEIKQVKQKNISGSINFIFVGAFTKGKQPFLCVKIIENLISKGYNVQLNMYGNGEEFHKIKDYVNQKSLSKNVILHGNQSKDVIKKAFIDSHFLLFISKSEGWPKVVAEAMFWKCLPIASNVSCVNYMLDNGNRGIVVDANINEKILLKNIESILNNNTEYQKKAFEAQNWSHNYTLDKFEIEIQKILNDE